MPLAAASATALPHCPFAASPQPYHRPRLDLSPRPFSRPCPQVVKRAGVTTKAWLRAQVIRAIMLEDSLYLLHITTKALAKAFWLRAQVCALP